MNQYRARERDRSSPRLARFCSVCGWCGVRVMKVSGLLGVRVIRCPGATAPSHHSSVYANQTHHTSHASHQPASTTTTSEVSPKYINIHQQITTSPTHLDPHLVDMISTLVIPRSGYFRLISRLQVKKFPGLEKPSSLFQ